MITKSGVFAFHALNMIIYGSMDSGRRMPVPEIQERSCSHKVRVTLHAENKRMIDSLCNLHREHNGLTTFHSSRRYCSVSCTGISVATIQL